MNETLVFCQFNTHTCMSMSSIQFWMSGYLVDLMFPMSSTTNVRFSSGS